MKKEVVNHHSEIVIDQHWSQLCDNKMVLPVKKGLIIFLGILEFLASLVIICVHGNKDILNVYILCIFICMLQTAFTCKYLRNVMYYKKLFPSQFIYFIGLSIMALGCWLMIFNIFPPIIELFIFLMIIGFFFIFGASFFLLSKVRKKERACNYKLLALCTDNRSISVKRMAVNTPHKKIERRASVAYSDEDTIIIYTPVFKYEYNSVEYIASPNRATNTPYEIGKEYEIYVNPNEPTKIRI